MALAAHDSAKDHMTLILNHDEQLALIVCLHKMIAAGEPTKPRWSADRSVNTDLLKKIRQASWQATSELAERSTPH